MFRGYSFCLFLSYGKHNGWNRGSLKHQAREALIVSITVHSDVTPYLVGGK